MLTLAEVLTMAIPFVALLISIVSAYSNSKHRSVDLAIKYSSYFQGTDPESLRPFDQVLNEEGKLAASFYMWKSFSRLTERKRSGFNYMTFLVFTFGWIGAGIAGAIKTYENSQTISAALIVGAAVMLLAVALMAYQRYESNLYSTFLELRNSDMYIDSSAAVFQAKDRVLTESLPSALVSLCVAAVATYYLDGNTVSMIWNTVILICALGNNVESVLKNKRWHSQASSSASNQKQKQSTGTKQNR